MAATDWNAFTDQTNARMAALRKEMPEVAPAFGSLAKAAIAPGELVPFQWPNLGSAFR